MNMKNFKLEFSDMRTPIPIRYKESWKPVDEEPVDEEPIDEEPVV
jgi:hypothetical protein